MTSSPKLIESVENGVVFPEVSTLDQEPELGNYQVKVKLPWLRAPKS